MWQVSDPGSGLTAGPQVSEETVGRGRPGLPEKRERPAWRTSAAASRSPALGPSPPGLLQAARRQVQADGFGGRRGLRAGGSLTSASWAAAGARVGGSPGPGRPRPSHTAAMGRGAYQGRRRFSHGYRVVAELRSSADRYDQAQADFQSTGRTERGLRVGEERSCCLAAANSTRTQATCPEGPLTEPPRRPRPGAHSAPCSQKDRTPRPPACRVHPATGAPGRAAGSRPQASLARANSRNTPGRETLRESLNSELGRNTLIPRGIRFPFLGSLRGESRGERKSL